MLERDIRSPEDALAYFADCQLATVSSMAEKKSRPKYEYERQIDIAQKMCDRLKEFNVKIHTSSRVFDVMSREDQSVAGWAKEHEA